MTPTLANGKICYVEMPASDIQRSAEFYEKVFDWQIRKRGEGATAFNDAVGQVSGTWVIGRQPSSTPGLLIYIMVDDVAATIEKLVARGGELVQPVGADAPGDHGAVPRPRREHHWSLPAARERMKAEG